MKIFSAAQIREWDAYTIAHEPITSIDLMERAATMCFNWITNHFKNESEYLVFCGTGNNGGDGLAIARMLLQAGKLVTVYVLEGKKRTDDFSINLERLSTLLQPIQYIKEGEPPTIARDVIIIDALFGTGLSKPLDGLPAELVRHINQSGNTVISIDMPSGLMADINSTANDIIRAHHTLSFQVVKLAFMITANGLYTGQVHLLDIDLHPDFYDVTHSSFYTTGIGEVTAIYNPRNQYAHKYNFGHALLYAGSKNMMGAAILCAKACLRAGCGLVTVYTETGTQSVIQTSFPEAIASNENDLQLLSKKKAAIGVGPGIEPSPANVVLLDELCSTWEGPLVIDATALHLLTGRQTALLPRKNRSTILTPHTGEFDKLFGSSSNDFDRLEKAKANAKMLNSYIVLKGPHTSIACPDGNVHFNTSGNAGMATAGSGDVLTGILTGLLSQGYSEREACLLGVYLHGLAGDFAAKKNSQEAMIASDIIDSIGDSFKNIRNLKSNNNLLT